MVNIYLFIELLHTANAVTTVDGLKARQMERCKFANVVVLSNEKIVAQLDCEVHHATLPARSLPCTNESQQVFLPGNLLCEKRALTCVSQSKIKAVAILPINPFER